MFIATDVGMTMVVVLSVAILSSESLGLISVDILPCSTSSVVPCISSMLVVGASDIEGDVMGVVSRVGVTRRGAM